MVECNGGSISGSFNIFSTAIINTGTLAWTANPVFMYGNTLVTNLAGATLNATNAAWLNYGSSVLGNAGTMNLWSGGSVSVPLVNSGTINIDSGTFGCNGGGTSAGAIDVASGAAFNLSGGTFSGATSSTIYGAGNLNLSGATFNSAGTLSLVGGGSGITVNLTGGVVYFIGNGLATPGTLNFSGGALAGTQTVAPGGPFNWSDGTMYGIVQSQSGNVTVPGANMYGGQIINNGGLGWNGTIYLYSGALISNTPSGTLNVTNISWNYESGGLVANAGVMNVWSGGGITAPVTNSGTINLNSGTLSLYSTLSLANGTLDFGIASTSSYGKLALSGAATLTGTLGVTFNGYSPSVNDTFGLISYGSESGAFTAFNLPATVTWQKTYGATLFSLTVSNLVSSAVSVILQPGQPPFTGQGFNLLVTGPIGTNYVVQVSTNLFPANWQTLTNFTSITQTSTITDTKAVASQPARFYRAFAH